MEISVNIAVVEQKLLRYVRAAQMSSNRYECAIRETLAELRSFIAGDDASAVAERNGPLGALERMLDDWYAVSPQRTDEWNIRWLLTLRNARKLLENIPQ